MKYKSGIIFFSVLFLISAFFFIQNEFYSSVNSNDKEEKLFLVEKGKSLFEISLGLEKKGLVKSKFLFEFYIFLNGRQRQLQAGEYLLSPSMNIVEISGKIISGDIIKETITIPEGWNLRDIGWYFENQGMFQAEELFELVGFPLIDYSKENTLPFPENFDSDYSFLKDKPEYLSFEGYLFPDTYETDRGEELESIVRKMLDNFDKKLTQELRAEINNQRKTIFEIITMASLIEKEVRTLEDKKLVSGVLWKRLESGVPLQVDATITYITGKRTTKVSREETKIDSPYNTYKHRGLPLGPISNPGLESILASMYPESSDSWYYLSTPKGETIFSKTLEEHNIAKVKYLK